MRHEIAREYGNTNYRKPRFLYKDLSSHLSLLLRDVQSYVEPKEISSNVKLKKIIIYQKVKQKGATTRISLKEGKITMDCKQ